MDRNDARPRRWAPEWIAVLTLAVAIVALGGALFTSLSTMEGRLREDMRAMRGDMRAMETRIREDLRELRGDVGVLRERVARLDERVLQLDGRVTRLDERMSRLDERVSRLETRFDEEFPRRAASVRSSAHGARSQWSAEERRLIGPG